MLLTLRKVLRKVDVGTQTNRDSLGGAFMFIGFNNLAGTVIYSCDKFRVLHIENSRCDRLTDDDLLDDLRKSPLVVAENCYNYFAPRYMSYIVLFKNEQMWGPTSLMAEDVKTLSDHDASVGFSTLNQFNILLSRHMGKSEEIDINPYFMTGFVNSNNEFSWGVNAINPSTPGKLDIKFQDFSIAWAEATNNAVGVMFINEFESLYASFNNEAAMLRMLDGTRKRSDLFRIAHDYLMVPVLKDMLPHITLNGLPQMTIDRMLAFFGCDKRSGSKIETFLECLKATQQRDNYGDMLKTFANGPVRLCIELNLTANNTLKYRCLPQDNILVLAPNMRILSSEEVADKPSGCINTRMIVEVGEKPSDDMANCLYSTLERNKGSYGVKIQAVTEKTLNSSIESLGKFCAVESV